MPYKSKFSKRRNPPPWISSVYNKYHQQRSKVVAQKKSLLYMVTTLMRMPVHLQKFFLKFMHGRQRAELARLLAARRLQARLRNSRNGRG